VHGEFLAATAQRLRDRGIDLEPELPGTFAAQIALGLLVYIQGNDFEIRLLPLAPVRIPHEKAIAHMLPVRKQPVDRRNDRQALRLSGRLCGGGVRGGLQKCASGKHAMSSSTSILLRADTGSPGAAYRSASALYTGSPRLPPSTRS